MIPGLPSNTLIARQVLMVQTIGDVKLIQVDYLWAAARNSSVNVTDNALDSRLQ